MSRLALPIKKALFPESLARLYRHCVKCRQKSYIVWTMTGLSKCSLSGGTWSPDACIALYTSAVHGVIDGLALFLLPLQRSAFFMLSLPRLL